MTVNHNEEQYLDLARHVLEFGDQKGDRTGTGTKSVFGYQMRFNLQEGFPILTTKKVAFGLVKSELLWFLRGDTNIRFLLEHKNHIWDEWAFKKWVESDHIMFQFYVNNGKLSCQLYQRSADIFLGVPFNIASYALLTHMIAHQCGLEVGEFVHTLGDAHIYLNHLDQIKEQLSRPVHQAPQLILPAEAKPIDEYQMEDIKLEGYEHEDAIKAPVAV